MSDQTVGVGEGLTAHLTAIVLLQPHTSSVHSLGVSRQMEVVSEGLPAHGAGVDALSGCACGGGLLPL